jgi:predicted nucleotidyltransferase component of viral defense system
MALDKGDIDSLSNGRDPYYVEKDYLQDIILFQIYEKSADHFVFKGGTALSKFYSSDRFSEDLDFTTRALPDPLAYFKDVMARSLRDIEYKTAYKEEPKTNKFGTINTTIIMQGPRYNSKASTLQHITLELNTRASLLYDPIPIPRAPNYPDARNYVALVMDKNEILAEKIRAIMGPKRRHKERDLYDMYFLLSKSAIIERKIVVKKLKEAGMELSMEKLNGEIAKIGNNWKELDLTVRHRLEEYSYVKSYVSERLSEALGEKGA